MYLSACIEWLFREEYPDFSDRVRAAKAQGFSHVEFHLWRDKPLAALAQALEETGVTLSSFVVEPRRRLVDPAEHEQFLAAVSDSLAVSRQLGSPPLVVASGFSREGVDIAEQQAQAVHILRQAATLAEAAGVTLLLEPLNTRIDHPGMFLNDTRLALDIIEAVDSPRLQLLFDVYHSMVMEEEMEEVLGGRMHRVGHVQIAQAPDRNEPDPRSGEWPALIARLQRLGYNGAIGLEYKPSLPAAASVARAREATGLSC
ncbi:TPA: TIM barrel protein [Klebsiella pneumoniae]|uniref:TIM barrel protein n=1 Tax=Klebsiella pneumoniae TaxID=573 RepID=UPI0012310D13|nr:TIM barrel protein [Klebsiella pneumoniae]MDH8226396.1 TIM barrel protein [Klebsiella pneumoniae]HBW1608029.1 TIM barrel protein [Klebsiella pneumoniae]HCQ9166147.1 TIM barrel protein [Klebsiella pneumoniae]HDQ3360346.1 TIM barrel protein [Klebsiella pneumoniae]